jgi:hypothetical protein
MRSNQPEVLRNITCCYCRIPSVNVASDKEHVIARGFVPIGTLQKSWNLIARACRLCNNRKSDLEDDMAILSLQHYPFDGTDPVYDAHIRECLEIHHTPKHGSWLNIAENELSAITNCVAATRVARPNGLKLRRHPCSKSSTSVYEWSESL